MKKGFTLIELLAVIVILAIILLIAIPIVQKTILDAQTESNKASIELYGRAADQAIERYQMVNHHNPNSFADIEDYIEYSGDRVVCSTKQINDDYTVYLANCTVGGDAVEEYTYGNSGSTSLEYVYMWCEGENVDGPSLNEVINPSNYAQTLPSGQNYYLKFKLDSTNKVIEGYACAIYNGTTYCIQGWDESYYGSYTGMSTTELQDVSNLNPTGNIQELSKIKIANPSYSCRFDSIASSCDDGTVGLTAYSAASVSAAEGAYHCGIRSNGRSTCDFYG